MPDIYEIRLYSAYKKYLGYYINSKNHLIYKVNNDIYKLAEIEDINIVLTFVKYVILPLYHKN